MLSFSSHRDHDWLEQTPDLEIEKGALGRTYRQSNLDLAALRLRPDNVTIRTAMPGRTRWVLAMLTTAALLLCRRRRRTH